MADQIVAYTVGKREGITKVQISFTSATGGAVVGAVVKDANAANYFVTGTLIGFSEYPDPSSTTPTAAFTFTVKDDDGIDLLNGLGAGSATATAQVQKVFADGLGVAYNTKLTFAAAAMGDAKHAILDLYFA